MSFSLKRSSVVRFVFLVLILFSSGLAQASHPYHVSRAEIEFNSQTNRFQIALCLWPEDLEKALAKRAGHSVDLDSTDQVEALMQSYVAEQFRIVAVDEATMDKALAAKAEVAEEARLAGGESTVSLKLESSGETHPEASVVDSDLSNALPITAKEIATTRPAAAKKPGKGFRWVGHELELKQAWLYFEIDGSSDVDSNSWEIENRMFFELNDDQFNQIQIGAKKDFITEPCSPDSSKVYWSPNGR